MLAKDKATRPKKKLSPKQLENLAKGRMANPKFKARDNVTTLPSRTPEPDSAVAITDRLGKIAYFMDQGNDYNTAKFLAYNT